MNTSDLYELASVAALDPGKWSEVLRAACVATGAMGGAIFSPGVDPAGPHLGAITNGYGDINGYKSYWAAQDPWLLAVAGKRFFDTAGDIRFGSEFLPEAALRRTGYYNDFGRFSGGGAGHKISLKVCDANDPHAPVTHFVVGRPLGTPAFDEEDKRQVARFWKPVQHAVRLHWKLTQRIAPQHSPVAGLDALPLPVVVLREDLSIEFSNSAATQMTQAGHPLKEVQGRLRSVGSLDFNALKALVSTSTTRCTKAVALAVEGNALRRMNLSLSPIREVPHYACAWPRASVLLVLLDGYSNDGDETPWQRCLGRYFKLTSAEQFVLERIAAGCSVQDIAQERGVIAATIRTHLGALFDKTGRRRQSELVRLALER